jgi:hypothetical protein
MKSRSHESSYQHKPDLFYNMIDSRWNTTHDPHRNVESEVKVIGRNQFKFPDSYTQIVSSRFHHSRLPESVWFGKIDLHKMFQSSAIATWLFNSSVRNQRSAITSRTISFLSLRVSDYGRYLFINNNNNKIYQRQLHKWTNRISRQYEVISSIKSAIKRREWEWEWEWEWGRERERERGYRGIAESICCIGPNWKQQSLWTFIFDEGVFKFRIRWLYNTKKYNSWISQNTFLGKFCGNYVMFRIP